MRGEIPECPPVGAQALKTASPRIKPEKDIGMALPEFTMRQLLEAGVHYGHQTARWNPKMGEYIYGDRNGIHILDLTQTVPMLDAALKVVRDTVNEFASMSKTARLKVRRAHARARRFPDAVLPASKNAAVENTSAGAHAGVGKGGHLLQQRDRILQKAARDGSAAAFAKAQI